MLSTRTRKKVAPPCAAPAFSLLVPAALSFVHDPIEGCRSPTRRFVAVAASRVSSIARLVVRPPLHGYALEFYWPAPPVRDQRAEEHPWLGRFRCPWTSSPRWSRSRRISASSSFADGEIGAAGYPSAYAMSIARRLALK
ncbi:MAG: hypothetical protein HYY16_08130 [Planctomycetes bacterium]|nr:hypothetical protein [Planctomycetota bacterium]